MGNPSKRWCYTINNYTDEDLITIKTVPTLYHVIGKEIGESGTPHLQGFLTLKKPIRLSGLKKLHQTAHWEAAKGTSYQASIYCKKEGDFEETGIVPTQGKRTDLEEAISLIKEGKEMSEIAEKCPTTYVKFSRGLRDLKLILDKPYTPSSLRGIWYWGPPGTGKSRQARELYPTAYLKSQSKWFDGYSGQKTILLDDLDTNVLGHYLKIWADRYACTGETKGGTINLQHDTIIITSNYSIDNLFKDDEEMARAIRRRFTVTHFNDPL